MGIIKIDITNIPDTISVDGLVWKLDPTIYSTQVDYVPVNRDFNLKKWHSTFRLMVTKGWYGSQLSTDEVYEKAKLHILESEQKYQHSLKFG